MREGRRERRTCRRDDLLARADASQRFPSVTYVNIHLLPLPPPPAPRVLEPRPPPPSRPKFLVLAAPTSACETLTGSVRLPGSPRRVTGGRTVDIRELS
eukprot:516265-Hanusia_phi.AAC.1